MELLANQTLLPLWHSNCLRSRHRPIPTGRVPPSPSPLTQHMYRSISCHSCLKLQMTSLKLTADHQMAVTHYRPLPPILCRHHHPPPLSHTRQHLSARLVHLAPPSHLGTPSHLASSAAAAHLGHTHTSKLQHKEAVAQSYGAAMLPLMVASPYMAPPPTGPPCRSPQPRASRLLTSS